MKKNLLSFLIIFFGVLSDQVSKFLIEGHFREALSQIVLIENFLNLIFVKNFGIVFGLFKTLPEGLKLPLVLVMPIVVLAVLFYYLFKLEAKQLLHNIAYSCIISGAIGNIVDRIRLKYVIDFIDLQLGSYHWYTFNIADVMIVVGMGFLIIIILMGQEIIPEKKKKT